MADENVRDAGAELSDEGIPDLEGQPPGKVRAGDTGEGLIPPRDHALGAEAHGTTAAEERRGEAFADRVAREEPDRERPDEHAGRLVQPGDGFADDEATEIGRSAGFDDGGFSAEEAAVHVVEDPPGLGTGDDGYRRPDLD